METKAFHESFIVNLQSLKNRLLKTFSDKKGRMSDVFIIRFRIELRPLEELLCITTIPQQFIPQVMKEINEFSENFAKEYSDFGCKEEMKLISDYFKIMLANLSER
ncbi:hypothetical protein GW758_01965 [Candidatus Falkowbacteria bacterium]|nr:hypothetical protein [Candidatus Falkowbacteria bacterium]